ncbi:hypothetical protein [Paraburkholderia sp. J94]|uniref:hypothetical protein n=1 Tax=Paraburkholderia sp. J94 TaxID=2805441 RepID=UPI002AAF568D|nr:hypothetical protein [Paraburkholderia sp. J94]
MSHNRSPFSVELIAGSRVRHKLSLSEFAFFVLSATTVSKKLLSASVALHHIHTVRWHNQPDRYNQSVGGLALVNRRRDVEKALVTIRESQGNIAACTALSLRAVKHAQVQFRHADPNPPAIGAR